MKWFFVLSFFIMLYTEDFIMLGFCKSVHIVLVKFSYAVVSLQTKRWCSELISTFYQCINCLSGAVILFHCMDETVSLGKFCGYLSSHEGHKNFPSWIKLQYIVDSFIPWQLNYAENILPSYFILLLNSKIAQEEKWKVVLCV